MSDLMTSNSGYATGQIDSATTQADDDSNPTVGEASAAKINGITTAIVQMQGVLGIGTDLKGTAADLVARLAVEHNASGSHKTLTVPSGGTGLATVTAGGVLGGNGTSAMQDSGVGAATQVLISNVTAAPSWGYGLLYHGPSACNTGSTRTHEGAIVISVNQNLSGIHYYTNFTIDAGVTVSVPANKRRLIIVATGVITINGTIYSVGAGGAGATAAAAAGDGTDQAGGGGGSVSGRVGGSVICNGFTVQAGGASGVPGATPAQVSGSDAFMFNSPFMVTGGAGGGDDAVSPTSGGAGGGSVVLIAPTIVLGAASFIDTRGANGTQNGSSGSAGGGAGNIYILTRTFTDNGCTFQQTGGTQTGGVSGGGGAGASGIRQVLIYG